MTQPTLAQEVGKRIAQERRLKASREHRDIDQKTVAKAVHVSRAAVSRWESGESVPKDSAMQRLAVYFGVTAAYLRYGEESRPGAPSFELTEPTKTKKRGSG